MDLLTAASERSSYLLLRELLRILRLLQQETIFCNGITLNQFIILDHVAETQGELELSSLHDLLTVDSSTTTRLIAPLLKRGLLRREKSARDPRAARLQLTPEGRRVHEEFWGCLAIHLRPLALELNGDGARLSVQKLVTSIRSCCTEGCC